MPKKSSFVVVCSVYTCVFVDYNVIYKLKIIIFTRRIKTRLHEDDSTPSLSVKQKISNWCSPCVTRISGFSHMKRGAAQRDLTSALMCSFRLVSGTKTWPPNQRALAPLGHIQATTTTELTMHRQASACCADIGEPWASRPLWSTDSGGYTEPSWSQDSALWN